MAAKQTSVALRPERGQQLRDLAVVNKMSTGEMLESLISRQARRDMVQIPGLMVHDLVGTDYVVLGIKRAKDGESLPITKLTTAEARQLARYLTDAAKKPCRLHAPFTTEADGVTYDIGKKGVAITVDALMSNKQHYRKTISLIMAQEFAEWLKAAVKKVEGLQTK